MERFCELIAAMELVRTNLKTGTSRRPGAGATEPAHPNHHVNCYLRSWGLDDETFGIRPAGDALRGRGDLGGSALRLV